MEDVRTEVLSPPCPLRSRHRAERASEVLHLYCIAASGTPARFGPIGLDGREVFAVHHVGLAAVVSRSPVRAYQTMPKNEVVPFLYTHQAVIERVMRTETVVPVKFGTTARTAAEVRRALECGRGALAAALATMEGRFELDVVVLWHDLQPTIEAIADREDFRTRKAAISRRPFEETRGERIELGRLLRDEVDLLRQQRAAEVLGALASVGDAVCPHPLADERMIANLAVLVQLSREPELRDALARLNERFGDRIDFRCVGPLPPYSFSTVQIRRFPFPAVECARKLLGLEKRATAAQVKAAYHRVAWTSHPDGVGPDGGSEVPFHEVVAASRTLTEYCEAGGGSFREPEVGQVVDVRLVGPAAEARSA